MAQAGKAKSRARLRQHTHHILLSYCNQSVADRPTSKSVVVQNISEDSCYTLDSVIFRVMVGLPFQSSRRHVHDTAALVHNVRISIRASQGRQVPWSRVAFHRFASRDTVATPILPRLGSLRSASGPIDNSWLRCLFVHSKDLLCGHERLD